LIVWNTSPADRVGKGWSEEGSWVGL